MLRLSRKMLYAIEAVLDVAYHTGSAPVQSQDITRRQGIPRRYLERSLQELVRHGILTGVRGPRGGYRLAKERRRITVGDIVRVVREVETAEDPIEEAPGSELGHKVVRPLWIELQEQLMQTLDGMTIDDLCTRADRANIKSEGRANLDFTI